MVKGTAANDVLIARQFIGRPRGLHRSQIAASQTTPDASGSERLIQALNSFGGKVKQGLEFGQHLSDVADEKARKTVDDFAVGQDIRKVHQTLEKHGIPFQDNPRAMHYWKQRVTEAVSSSLTQQFAANLENEADGYQFGGDDAKMVEAYNKLQKEQMEATGLSLEDDAVRSVLGQSAWKTIQGLSQKNQAIQSRKLQDTLQKVETANLISTMNPEELRADPIGAYQKLRDQLTKATTGGAFNNTDRLQKALHEVSLHAATQGATDFLELVGQLQDPVSGRTMAELGGAGFEQIQVSAANRATRFQRMETAEFNKALYDAVQSGNPEEVYKLNNSLKIDSPEYEQRYAAFNNALIQVEQRRLEMRQDAARQEQIEGNAEFMSNIGDTIFQTIKDGRPLSNEDLPVNPFSKKRVTGAEAKELVLSRFQEYAQGLYAQSDNPAEVSKHLTRLVGQANGYLDGWMESHGRNGIRSLMGGLSEARDQKFKFNGQTQNALSIYKAARETGGLHLQFYSPEDSATFDYVLDQQRLGVSDKEIAQLLENRKERLRIEPDFERNSRKEVAKALDGKTAGWWAKTVGQFSTNKGGTFFGKAVMDTPEFKDRVHSIAVTRATLTGGKPADFVDEAIEIVTKDSTWVNGYPLSKKAFTQYDPKGNQKYVHEDATKVIRDRFAPMLKEYGLNVDDVSLRLSSDGKHVVASHPFLADGVNPTSGHVSAITVEDMVKEMNFLNEARVADGDKSHSVSLADIKAGREMLQSIERSDNPLPQTFKQALVEPLGWAKRNAKELPPKIWEGLSQGSKEALDYVVETYKRHNAIAEQQLQDKYDEAKARHQKLPKGIEGLKEKLKNY